MIDELNSIDFTTKLGTLFSLNGILTNEKYTGVYVYNKTAKKMLLVKGMDMHTKILMKYGKRR